MAKVELQSGGSIEVDLVDVDLFELSQADRQFVFGLVGKVTGYREKHREREESWHKIFIGPPDDSGRAPLTVGEPHSPALETNVGGQSPSVVEPDSDVKPGTGAQAPPAPVVASEPAKPPPPPEEATPAEPPRSVTTDLGEPRARQGELIRVLRSSDGPLSVIELTGRLQEVDHRVEVSNVRSDLANLKRKNEVTNPDRGMWKAVPAVDEDPSVTDGDQPEPNVLEQLVKEIQEKKQQDPVKPHPLEHVPVPFVKDPLTFREDVEEDRARKQLEALENKYGQVADELPLAHGPACKWHAGCDQDPARVVPSYSGGRLLSTFTTECCRRHALIRIQAYRITVEKAREFAAEWAERKVG